MRVASLLVILAVVFGQTTDRPSAYTAEQADAGRMEIRTNAFGDCTGCHTTTLGGRNGDVGELPPVSSLPENYQKIIDGYLTGVPAEKLTAASRQLGGNFDGPILEFGF